VITSGYGKNPDEALAQALRNAVEEAVGTYMTSTTRIENDELIEDKILSLSRGFIKDFKKLSEMKVDGETKVTVSVIVTKTQILETLKASGVKVEIKGGLFYQQYAQEEAQMEDEANVVKEFTRHLPQESPFDYSLEYGTPVKQSDSKFKIPLTVTVKFNQNYSNHYTNLKNLLDEVAIDKTIFKQARLTKPNYPYGLINLGSERFPKSISETELEKLQQRYSSRNIESNNYLDLFENSAYSPYAVLLIEKFRSGKINYDSYLIHEPKPKSSYIEGDVLAFRLLNEESLASLRELMNFYFYGVKFTVLLHSTKTTELTVGFNFEKTMSSQSSLRDGISYISSEPELASFNKSVSLDDFHKIPDVDSDKSINVSHFIHRGDYWAAPISLMSIIFKNNSIFPSSYRYSGSGWVKAKDNNGDSRANYYTCIILLDDLFQNSIFVKIDLDLFVSEDVMKSLNKLEIIPATRGSKD